MADRASREFAPHCGFARSDNLEVVAAAGYRAIAFDRFGAGLSDKRESLDFSHAAGADLTAALLDALQIERATIVGHSAGGYAGVGWLFQLSDAFNRDLIAFLARYSHLRWKIVCVPPSCWRGTSGS